METGTAPVSSFNSDLLLMIILDDPYVSAYLIDIIKSNQLPVLHTGTASKWGLNSYPNWIDEITAVNQLISKVHPKIYTNSENSINWIS